MAPGSGPGMRTRARASLPESVVLLWVFLSAIQVIGFVIGVFSGTIWPGSGKPVLTWLVIATGLSLGMWTTLMLRKIPPGQELESNYGVTATVDLRTPLFRKTFLTRRRWSRVK